MVLCVCVVHPPRTQGPEKLCIDWVSLTHNTAWRGGKLNPFHPGLVDKLMELAPQHLRFPGGAFVEGTTMESAYRWQLAVGPRELRPGHPGTNWGYWSSGGLGLVSGIMAAAWLCAHTWLCV